MRRRVRGPYAQLARIDDRLAEAAAAEAVRADRLEQLLTVAAGQAELLAASEGRLAAAQAEHAGQLGRLREELAQAREELARAHSELSRAQTGLAQLMTNGVRASHHTLALLSGEIRGLLRALAAEEPGNRRRLSALRSSADYAAAWEEPEPLVSVTIAASERPDLLRERSLPSVLGQSYGNLEVIVVGDAVGETTERAVTGFADPRVSFANLTQQHRWHPDPRRNWLVASTAARNEAMRRARGAWVVAFDDDDELAPDAIERLLAHARAHRVEVAYGRVRLRWDDGEQVIGAFPPRLGEIAWGGALYHAGLRFFERHGFAAEMSMPGDGFLLERMLRAGVRFGMLEEIVCDVHPSTTHHDVVRQSRGGTDRRRTPREPPP